MNRNPISVGYYFHENCYCYQVLNPWTKYTKNTIFLCPVKDGKEKALELAKKVLTQNMIEALSQPIELPDEND